MRGELAEGVVPGLLRELYVGRRDGTLTLARGEERQSLRFRHGHIVNAHTNVVEERLGEMLVRRGLLSAADLDRVAPNAINDNVRQIRDHHLARPGNSPATAGKRHMAEQHHQPLHPFDRLRRCRGIVEGDVPQDLS